MKGDTHLVNEQTHISFDSIYFSDHDAVGIVFQEKEVDFHCWCYLDVIG